MSFRSTVLRFAVGLLVATSPFSAIGPASAAASTAGPRPTIEQPFVVVIDAGHGGTNAGCQGFDGHLDEKGITLVMAQQLAGELATRLPHADIRLTRDDDRTMTLAERVAIANEAQADLFISLHANASPDATQTGFETYVLDATASSLEAARTARRENDGGLSKPTAKADAGHAEASRMLRQLQMTADRTRAAGLAHAIQRAQASRFPERSDRGVKQAPFDVLMGARMPAVLFEAGFLDHGVEGRVLAEPQSRAMVVDGLADAIVEHYHVSTRLR